MLDILTQIGSEKISLLWLIQSAKFPFIFSLDMKCQGSRGYEYLQNVHFFLALTNTQERSENKAEDEELILG